MSSICYDTIDQNCDTCYEITVSDCLDITIPTGLTPTDVYWLWCVAADGNIYKNQVTIQADSSFDIDIASYQDGLFNKYAYKFEFFLSTSETDSTPVTMTISSQEYNCLILDWLVNCCDIT